jgi:hypothetical protein
MVTDIVLLTVLFCCNALEVVSHIFLLTICLVIKEVDILYFIEIVSHVVF